MLSPVLNETQQLIIDSTITSVASTSVTFSIPEAPPGITGGELTYTSAIDDFANDQNGEIANALRTFGYSNSQFEFGGDFNPGDDLGFEIRYKGNEFGNMNLPDIAVEVNETNPADDIPTQRSKSLRFLLMA